MEKSGHTKTKKGEAGEAKSRARWSFPLIPRGLFTKNSPWQAKQLVLHTTVMFYGDCVKMCQDFAPNFVDKITSYCITTMHNLTLPFSPGNFWPKTTWLSYPIHCTFLCSPIEDKIERPPFRHKWGDWDRFAGGAEHPHRSLLPGCI
jgi:hypothetical protein